MRHSETDCMLTSAIDLVLEWVPGGDLLDYILKRNGLSKLARLALVNLANMENR